MLALVQYLWVDLDFELDLPVFQLGIQGRKIIAREIIRLKAVDLARLAVTRLGVGPVLH